MSLSVAAGRAIFDGPEHAGLWIACLAVAAAVAGGLVWRISEPLKTAADRAPYRRQAVALYLEAAGVAAAVIAGVEYESWIIALSGVVVMSLFAVAFVRVPDDTATPAARVRRGLDGLFIAGCVLFSILMLIPPDTAELILQRYYLVLIPAAAAAAMAGVGLVAVIRATAHRRRYLLLVCSLSVVAAAHVGVVLASLGVLSVWQCRLLVVVWGAGCLVSAGAAWLARRFPGPATAVPLPRVDVTVTLLPALAASVTALYHGFAIGPLGVDAILTAMAVVGVLSVRQVLARIDVRRYARVLSDREAYYRSIVSGSSDITTVVGVDGRMRFQAASAPWPSHGDPTRVDGTPFAEMVHPDDASTVDRQLETFMAGESGRRVRIDARIKDAEGHWRDTESIVADQRDNPQVDGLIVHTRDVGERRALERELAKLAFTDALTTLSNRRALLRTLESDVAGGSMPCTLLAVDLDGFKNVNDTRGHDIGDKVLIEVAKRLRSSLRPTDVAARLGGDEFAVLLWCPPERGYEIAERLLAVLAEPYRFEGHGHASVFLSSSIGLAGCATADDVQALLRNADLALRSAKQQGKNQIEAYDEEFEKRVRRRNVLEHELHGAIHRGELHLEYQPVISLPHRRVVGAEALLRWRHPTLGAVSPAEFIPVVEDAGMSADLATWTLGQVAERLAVWKAGGHPAWVSINLSPRQLHSRLFATDLAQALLSKGVPPSRLVVEVTEHDVAQDMDILVAQLGALRGTGVRIALDDFGAGYSSLGQLHRLPVDILKIDRDLVAGSDEGAAPLADVVVRLGERLGLAVIAEGVETETQLDVVKQAGCAMVQGYLLARPMPVDKVDALLREDIRLHATEPLAIES